MTFDADELENGACAATGLDDFGSPYYREGLERIVEALNTEADLNEIGQVIQHATISNALIQRLKIEDTYRQHPEIDDEVVGGPVFVIGLPRTGTTALSQLVAADPQFRSLRMWESQAPTPPPEAATQHTDPRIAQAEAGLKMLDDMFPLMKTMHNSEATAPTECQDLMGMSFRTFHFDGAVRAPGYLAWLMDCDMRETYTFHRRVLKLLQWHCPPTLWHLKTPVHMFALDALVEAYPERQIPVEPPRSGQGDGLGVQPDPVRAQLEQRPQRRQGARRRAGRQLGRSCPAGNGFPHPDGRRPVR